MDQSSLFDHYVADVVMGSDKGCEADFLTFQLVVAYSLKVESGISIHRATWVADGVLHFLFELLPIHPQITFHHIDRLLDSVRAVGW